MTASTCRCAPTRRNKGEVSVPIFRRAEAEILLQQALVSAEETRLQGMANKLLQDQPHKAEMEMFAT